ncbi:tudor domain-containing protein [Aureococcus anophagefferens]|nr:tudor domain-containing protein [Aureococcus anophagefferens]
MWPERLACRVAAGGDGAAIRTSWAVAARPGVGRAAVAYTTTAPCGRTFGSCCADDVLEFLDLAPKRRSAAQRAGRRRRPSAQAAGRRARPPPRPDDEPATYDGVVYRMGERVRARYNRGSVAYGALVARVYREADGPLYDLVYDDGFRDARLPARFIRDVVRASPLEIRRADSRDWIFFESQAIALRQLGPLLTQQMLLRLLHSKAWDDDPFRARRVDAKAGVKIRNARDREQDDDFRPNRAVGDPVLAQYDRAGIFYKGTISKVHDGGRAYDVRYEDGDEELDIDAYYVLDADDPRGAEGVEGLDGLVEAEPPRPAKQAKKRPRDEKPAKKKDRDETFPRPARPVEVRRRGSDAWTHSASLSKAAKHYKNLPAWLVQRLVSDPTLKHDVFECRAADAAPPPAKKARGACEAGAVVVLRSGGCWRRGVADGEGAVAFEDGRRAPSTRPTWASRCSAARRPTADGEAVPEAWLLDAADLVGRAVARVEQGGRRWAASPPSTPTTTAPGPASASSGAAPWRRARTSTRSARSSTTARSRSPTRPAGVAALRAENARAGRRSAR